MNWFIRRCMYIGFDWRFLGLYGNRGLERIGKTILCALGRKTFVHPRSYRKANNSLTGGGTPYRAGTGSQVESKKEG